MEINFPIYFTLLPGFQNSKYLFLDKRVEALKLHSFLYFTAYFIPNELFHVSDCKLSVLSLDIH